MGISVVINTLNEEANLPRALASVRGFADEIVVVDMHSDDNTVKIAKKFGARVFSHERTNYVEPARNFAISKATEDWIFVLDGDEELTSTLKGHLKKLINSEKPADYYRIPRKNIIFGKWIKHSRWWPDYNIRFFKKGKVSWNEVIHSVPMTEGDGIDLASSEEYAIVHHNYSSLSQFIERMNRYTTVQAQDMKMSGKHFEWQSILTKPTSEFLSRYFQGEGYKDGIHGLALSCLQAFSELVTILKLWEDERFKEQIVKVSDVVSVMKDSQSDIFYWQADTLLKTEGGFKHRIKRKFKLP